MTGTAKTEEAEFQGIYSLDVVQVPTNRPMIRNDMNDMIYRSKKGKYAAVVEEIIKRFYYERGAVQHALKDSPELKKAMEVLQDTVQYHKVFAVNK